MLRLGLNRFLARAKERRSLRSFTTSGTVTDIVARMELEEGDPLVKDIAEIVRKSENRLKMQLRQRHYEFLASVKVRCAS